MPRRITTLRKQVQALAQAGAERGVAGLDWSALDRQALTVAAERGASENPTQLAPLVERLTGLHAQAKTALSSGPGCPVGCGETVVTQPEAGRLAASWASGGPCGHAPSIGCAPGRAPCHGRVAFCGWTGAG